MDGEGDSYRGMGSQPLEEPHCMQGYFEGYKCLSLKVICDMEAEKGDSLSKLAS